MATLANTRRGVDNFGKRYVEADVTLSASYATGGEAISLAVLPGLIQVERVELIFVPMPDINGATTSNTHGRQIVPVVTNKVAPKLKVFTSNNTEAANLSDQSQITQRVRFVGH
jgi:hypothetical protein